MVEPMLGPDRVTLLLALVPYLTENGPTPVGELAAAFDVRPELVRRLVQFLGTAGVPGETLTYQHEDLFDIDWDALEQHDVVSLTRVIAVDDAPRFAPAETAALVGGLQALTAVLPAADAQLARETAEKLGQALHTAGAETLSITTDARDPALPELISAIEVGAAVSFSYRDAAGRESARTVDAATLVQEGDGWYLQGHCRERGAMRTFRVDQMRDIRAGVNRQERTAAEAVSTADTSAAPDRGAAGTECDLIAVLPEHALLLIAGFDPEVLALDGDGIARVRIRAWHPGAAVRLVQQAPGQVTVEEPASARRAVREWADRARAAYDA